MTTELQSRYFFAMDIYFVTIGPAFKMPPLFVTMWQCFVTFTGSEMEFGNYYIMYIARSKGTGESDPSTT